LRASRSLSFSPIPIEGPTLGSMSEELRELKHTVREISDRNKFLEERVSTLTQQLYSVETLKQLASLSGIFSSKTLEIDPSVQKKFERLLMEIFNFLLPEK
jgi:hypothetical protein